MWLAAANIAVGVAFAAITYLFILPNCPGEYCGWRINRLTDGAILVFAGGNLCAISLYFSNRFWRK